MKHPDYVVFKEFVVNKELLRGGKDKLSSIRLYVEARRVIEEVGLSNPDELLAYLEFTVQWKGLDVDEARIGQNQFSYLMSNLVSVKNAEEEKHFYFSDSIAFASITLDLLRNNLEKPGERISVKRSNMRGAMDALEGCISYDSISQQVYSLHTDYYVFGVL